MWQALTEGYLSYRGRSVDSLAKVGATTEATIPESNRGFQQKSAEVIVVSPWARRRTERSSVPNAVGSIYRTSGIAALQQAEQGNK